MKGTFTLTIIASIAAVLMLIPPCEAAGASGGEIARKEALLAQSGFKVVTVTPSQTERGNKGTCSGQVFRREGLKKAGLRVSHCNEG